MKRNTIYPETDMLFKTFLEANLPILTRVELSPKENMIYLSNPLFGKMETLVPKFKFKHAIQFVKLMGYSYKLGIKNGNIVIKFIIE